MIVVDTGALYAAADTSDAHHDQCAELLDEQPRPLVVPVSVVIEASYLVEHRLGPLAEQRFLSEIVGDDYQVEQLAADDVRRMAELVNQYADLLLGAVDASVVAVCERLGAHEVATLDHRHFRVVRPRLCECPFTAKRTGPGVPSKTSSTLASYLVLDLQAGGAMSFGAVDRLCHQAPPSTRR